MRVRSVKNRVNNVIYLLPCGGIVPCECTASNNMPVV